MHPYEGSTRLTFLEQMSISGAKDKQGLNYSSYPALVCINRPKLADGWNRLDGRPCLKYRQFVVLTRYYSFNPQIVKLIKYCNGSRNLRRKVSIEIQSLTIVNRWLLLLVLLFCSENPFRKSFTSYNGNRWQN